MKPLPSLYYIGNVLVGVASACDCPAPVYPGDGPACVPDHPHESHDIVPVRSEEELPEGVKFEDYRRWCRMFAAAPDLLAVCEEALAWADSDGLKARLAAAIAKAVGGPRT